MPTPFDDLFHFVFQHAHHAVWLLRGLLPTSLVAAIDWHTLRAAGEKVHDGTLRQRTVDALFAADLGRGGALWLLIEHKSFPGRELQRQLLRYLALLQDAPPGPGDGLPLAVVPLVLYHGAAPLPAAAPHAAIDAALAPLQPHVPFVLDDLRLTDERQLRERNLTPLGTLALLCLHTVRDLDPPQVLASLERWADLLRAADRDPQPPGGENATRAIYWYVLRVTEVDPRDLQATLERILQRPEDQTMGTLDRLLREGHERGRAEGKAEGRTEGKAEGRTEAMRMVLTGLLQRRFGALRAETAARVETASFEQLQSWTDRVLDVASVEELLGGA